MPAFSSSFVGAYPNVKCSDGVWHQFTIVIPNNAELANVQIFIDGVNRTPVYLYYAFGAPVYINTLNLYHLRFGVNGG